MTREIGIAVAGLGGGRFRVVALTADGVIFDEEVAGVLNNDATNAAHAAVDMLVARRGGDAPACTVYVRQQALAQRLRNHPHAAPLAAARVAVVWHRPHPAVLDAAFARVNTRSPQRFEPPAAPDQEGGAW